MQNRLDYSNIIGYSAHLLWLVLLLSTSCSTSPPSKPSAAKATIPTKEQVGALRLPIDIAPVKAPFVVPQFKKPSFPAYTLSITERGAQPGAKVTQTIQATIDAVSQHGGGTVLIPAGKWHTGRISLKSNVNLHLDAGAELYFSGEVEDYRPAVFTRNEGVEVMSLGACIYANGQENIAVTGSGRLIGPMQGGSVRKQVMEGDVVENIITASMPVAERVYEGYNGSPIFLPMFISPINCRNVYIEGISLENTAFWNIVPVYCDGVIIRGITVNSVGIPRGDGIDVESSRNVLIEYSTLSCGDDCFTIKAGRGEDGLRVNKPTENVVVRYCLAREGHGGITCGSETAGMIRNLYVHDCVFDNTGVGIRFKTRRPRGGGGENLTYERIRMNLKDAAFNWDMLGSKTYVGELAVRLPARSINPLTPHFANITAKDIIVENASQFVKVNAIPETPLTHVVLENLDINAKKLFTAADVQDFTVRNATIRTTDAQISLIDARNVLFDKVQFIVPGATLVADVSGEKSADIRFKDCTPNKPASWQQAAWNQ
ncbi:glycoside hydrolase family 28 protein [Hymenobacter sp. GOD-10R]|uniref:glycoside hydrolase family 28 protein n=1 Tax=Hymenobacter sp. GOD-10R TaxID=3093922 RepID=UPI002D777918|nr:glycoside hydrolase family 28 protein [Hymenobacter sp. GOD-10R]WRQ30323.1 glycoside hydrolase family 28 protein [Hymenobacter sp. GOD-10R]